VCTWLEGQLKAKDVAKVSVSSRLTDSPAALVQGAYGMSPTMQRYMRAQAVASGMEEGMLGGMNQATLELNPSHPIIDKLKTMVEADESAPVTVEYGTLVYEVAALASGYSLEDPAAFANLVTKLMSSDAVSMPSAKAPEQVEAEVVESTE